MSTYSQKQWHVCLLSACYVLPSIQYSTLWNNRHSFLCVIVTQGDIQQLLIVEDPGAAETYCQDFIPDCHAPLPYNSILIETEEVRPPLPDSWWSGRVEGALRGISGVECCKSRLSFSQ